MSADDKGAAGWLRDRVGWGGIVAALSEYRAPRRGFVFYLGGITLFLLVIQVVTGVLLLLHYRPDAAQAHASLARIVGEIPYGNPIRGVHVWASDLFVASLVAHLFTILFRKTYTPPHEPAWLSGHVALVLGIGFAFTGAVLPWSQQAYAHARMGSELARYTPLIGERLAAFMRGGDEISPATLQHAFGFHVAALPALTTLFVGLHLFFLMRKPPILPEEAAQKATIPLYPDFAVRLAVAWTGALVALMTLAIFFERPIGEAADPRLPTGAAHPPWYFLPWHQVVTAAPGKLLGIEGPRFLVGAACLLGVVAVALPFLDRRGSRITTAIAGLSLAALVLLGIRALA
jgi:quinol-cytochrome oxidoreductase complex cytochrome b subunit